MVRDGEGHSRQGTRVFTPEFLFSCFWQFLLAHERVVVALGGHVSGFPTAV